MSLLHQGSRQYLKKVILYPTEYPYIIHQTRRLVGIQTQGRALKGERIGELRQLLDAYRKGIIKEKNKSTKAIPRGERMGRKNRLKGTAGDFGLNIYHVQSRATSPWQDFRKVEREAQKKKEAMAALESLPTANLRKFL